MRSSGPGGQNVNKLSTAVQLRFNVRNSPSLPNDVALRLMRLAGRRMTKDGVLVLIAQNHRTQERNRAEAQERLIALVQEAAVKPVPRRATKPSKASKQKRLEGKKRRAVIKRHGAVVEMGTTDRVFGNPLHPYTKALLGSVPQLHTKWADAPALPPADEPGGPLVEVEEDHYVASAAA